MEKRVSGQFAATCSFLQEKKKKQQKKQDTNSLFNLSVKAIEAIN